MPTCWPRRRSKADRRADLKFRARELTLAGFATCPEHPVRFGRRIARLPNRIGRLRNATGASSYSSPARMNGVSTGA